MATMVAELAYSFLGHDIATVALPVMFFRVVVQTTNDVPFINRTAQGFALGVLAFGIFAGGRGTYLGAIAVLLAQYSSRCLFISHWRFVGVLLLSASICFAATAWPMFTEIAAAETWAKFGCALTSAAMSRIVIPMARRRGASLATLAALPVIVALGLGMPAASAALARATVRALSAILPISEFGLAYRTARLFMTHADLEARLSALALVTFHAQYSVGHVGVAYLRTAQLRKNQLLAVAGGAIPPSAGATSSTSADDVAAPAPTPTPAPTPAPAKLPSPSAKVSDGASRTPRRTSRSPARARKAVESGGTAPKAAGSHATGENDHAAAGARAFVRSVGWFLLLTALPYMGQRTALESINAHALRTFLDASENELRLNLVLADGAALGALAKANHTVESYVDALRTTVNTPFNLAERKLFSLPKLALLPAVVGSHPLLSALGLPLALLVDAGKSALVATISRRVEAYRRHARLLGSRRTRVEAFDTKHAAALTSANALSLSRETWRELTVAIQDAENKWHALKALRQWVRWLYWQVRRFAPVHGHPPLY